MHAMLAGRRLLAGTTQARFRGFAAAAAGSSKAPKGRSRVAASPGKVRSLLAALAAQGWQQKKKVLGEVAAHARGGGSDAGAHQKFHVVQRTDRNWLEFIRYAAVAVVSR